MLNPHGAHQALFMASMSVSAGIAIWALTDACHHDRQAFRRAGYHRMAWILLVIAGCAVALLGNPVGLLMAAAVGVDYLVIVRARVRAASVGQGLPLTTETLVDRPRLPLDP